jgi:hypothetical protein
MIKHKDIIEIIVNNISAQMKTEISILVTWFFTNIKFHQISFIISSCPFSCLEVDFFLKKCSLPLATPVFSTLGICVCKFL